MTLIWRLQGWEPLVEAWLAAEQPNDERKRALADWLRTVRRYPFANARAMFDGTDGWFLAVISATDDGDGALVASYLVDLGDQTVTGFGLQTMRYPIISPTDLLGSEDEQ